MSRRSRRRAKIRERKQKVLVRVSNNFGTWSKFISKKWYRSLRALTDDDPVTKRQLAIAKNLQELIHKGGERIESLTPERLERLRTEAVFQADYFGLDFDAALTEKLGSLHERFTS